MIPVFDNTTKAGTASGTLLTVFANMHSSDVITTVALAAIGAVVSFAMTVLLKYVLKKMRKNR